jgi:hypothetical protein
LTPNSAPEATAVDPSSRPAGEATLTEIGDARREATRQQAELAGLLRVGGQGGGPVLFAAAPVVPVIAGLGQ